MIRKKEIFFSIYCSVVAGTIMIILEMTLVHFITDHSIWETPRKMAAIAMGDKVLEPTTFDPAIFAVAMAVHFSLSTIYGLIFSLITKIFGSKPIAVFGVLFGLSLYVINFYGFSNLFFPWFIESRNWIMIIAHLAFGFTLELTLKRLSPGK